MTATIHTRKNAQVYSAFTHDSMLKAVCNATARISPQVDALHAHGFSLSKQIKTIAAEAITEKWEPAYIASKETKQLAHPKAE